MRDDLETDPVRFMTRLREPLWDAAREAIAAFVGAQAEGLVFVHNATTGINTVLRSWRFEQGDEILVTDHGYRACTAAAVRVAGERGAMVRTVPLVDAESAPDALADAVGDRTVLALVDHVTSPTGLILPVEEIVRRLGDRGVQVIVDGAHAPGMVETGIEELGAAAYAGNLHKWVCAPKGAGFLWVAPDLRDRIVPLVTSHGEVARRRGRSHFHDRFDWLGTDDSTAVLTAPTALDVLSRLGVGWPAIRRRNRSLTLAARQRFLGEGFEPVGSQDSVGSMVAVRLGHSVDPATADEEVRRLGAVMYDEYRVQMPVTVTADNGDLMVRLSVHLHTGEDDVDRGIDAVVGLRQRTGTTR